MSRHSAGPRCPDYSKQSISAQQGGANASVTEIKQSSLQAFGDKVPNFESLSKCLNLFDVSLSCMYTNWIFSAIVLHFLYFYVKDYYKP